MRLSLDTKYIGMTVDKTAAKEEVAEQMYLPPTPYPDFFQHAFLHKDKEEGLFRFVWNKFSRQISRKRKFSSIQY